MTTLTNITLSWILASTTSLAGVWLRLPLLPGRPPTLCIISAHDALWQTTNPCLQGLLEGKGRGWCQGQRSGRSYWPCPCSLGDGLVACREMSAGRLPFLSPSFGADTRASDGSVLCTVRTSTWSARRPSTSLTSCYAMTTRRGSRPAKPWNILTSVRWPSQSSSSPHRWLSFPLWL